MLMGDMNARMGNVQANPITWNELDKNEQMDLACTWQRVSQDDTINTHGRALCNLMHGMHLLVLNGMHLFPHTHMYTCHTQQVMDIVWRIMRLYTLTPCNM